jgi:hypothetical protein
MAGFHQWFAHRRGSAAWYQCLVHQRGFIRVGHHTGSISVVHQCGRISGVPVLFLSGFSSLSFIILGPAAWKQGCSSSWYQCGSSTWRISVVSVIDIGVFQQRGVGVVRHRGISRCAHQHGASAL